MAGKNIDANNETMKMLREASLNNGSKLFMEAAKELVDIVATTSFDSPEFQTQIYAYLMIEPEDLEQAKENLPDFCKKAQKSDLPFASGIIKCFVDRITNADYKIDFNTLTTIGVILGNNEYENEGVRCLKRAGAMVKKPK